MSATGTMKKKKYEKELTAKELAELPDSEIDYSDIPPLGKDFWETAEVIFPEGKTQLTMRVDNDVLEFFKRGGPGYQTRMNAVLRSYFDAQQVRTKKRTQA